MLKRLFVTLLVVSSTVFAHDIEGVQPAALDQPRINLHLRRTPKGPPLAAGEVINIQAFLDTGASGILLSGKTARALGVKPLEKVTFHDIGVGGDVAFNVSEPLHVFLAPFKSSGGEPDDPGLYPITLGPVRTQILHGGGLIEMLTGGLDVVGTPAMKGRIVLMDPKPVDKFDDTMRCAIFERSYRDLPKTDRHVHLTYVDFKPFTRTTPENAEGPTLSANPMIGPHPLGKPDAKKSPPVVAGFGEKKIAGTWLLDTGAAASMISKKHAAAVGVKYVEGSEGTDSPRLENVPEKDQFTLDVGGIGGMKKAAGFFLSTLVIPTRERDPLVYIRAPVLIIDITATDSKTKQSITLDGVLGMNFFVASANVTQKGLLPDIDDLTVGPYEWIIIDEATSTLGLKIKK